MPACLSGLGWLNRDFGTLLLWVVVSLLTGLLMGTVFYQQVRTDEAGRQHHSIITITRALSPPLLQHRPHGTSSAKQAVRASSPLTLPRALLPACLAGAGWWLIHQALRNWRNLVGLVFSTTVASLLLGTIGAVLRFPLEWAVLSREYLSGANAAGPYVAARFMSSMVLSVGPVIMASLMYWMTGENNKTHTTPHQQQRAVAAITTPPLTHPLD